MRAKRLATPTPQPAEKSTRCIEASISFPLSANKISLMKSVRSSRVRFGITAISSLLALAVQPLHALDNWIRTPLDGTGLWTDGLNWSNGLPPNGTPAGNEEGRID